MSVHKYSSWGRTRRPKNITGEDGTKANQTTIGALTALDIANTGSNINAGNGIYKTENQRFLHIHCSGSQTVSNVYCYLYASQQWSELKRFDFQTGTDRESIVVGANEYVVVDIYGADLIAVAGSNNPSLAFSTF
jgi:hypothetical protein